MDSSNEIALAPEAGDALIVVGLAPSTPQVSKPVRKRRGEARLQAKAAQYLAATDVLSVSIALFLLLGVPGRGDVRYSALLAVPLTVIAAKMFGLYDREQLMIRKSTFQELPRLAALGITVVLGIWLADDIFFVNPASRTEAVLAAILTIGIVALGRVLVRALVRLVAAPEVCILLVADSDERRIRGILTGARELAVMGELETARIRLAVDSAEGTLALPLLVEEFGIGRAIIDPATCADQEEALDLMRELGSCGVRSSIIPSTFGVVEANVVADDVYGATLYGVADFGLSRSSRAMKRLFDLTAASMLVLLLMPVWLIIALLIKLGSEGPVFFRQRRVGMRGKKFTMIKFRTMVRDADSMKSGLKTSDEHAGLFKIADDPRITRVGHYLRKYSVDEVPQLLNVLLGEMSMVGPRPLIVDEDAKINGRFRDRLEICPGMTGPWQVASAVRLPLSEMVKLDYAYISAWTLWGDMTILSKTLRFVVRGSGV